MTTEVPRPNRTILKSLSQADMLLPTNQREAVSWAMAELDRLAAENEELRQEVGEWKLRAALENAVKKCPGGGSMDDIFCFVVLRKCGCVAAAASPQYVGEAAKEQPFLEALKAGEVKTVPDREAWLAIPWKCDVCKG